MKYTILYDWDDDVLSLHLYIYIDVCRNVFAHVGISTYI